MLLPCGESRSPKHSAALKGPLSAAELLPLARAPRSPKQSAALKGPLSAADPLPVARASRARRPVLQSASRPVGRSASRPVCQSPSRGVGQSAGRWPIDRAVRMSRAAALELRGRLERRWRGRERVRPSCEDVSSDSDRVVRMSRVAALAAETPREPKAAPPFVPLAGPSGSKGRGGGGEEGQMEGAFFQARGLYSRQRGELGVNTQSLHGSGAFWTAAERRVASAAERPPRQACARFPRPRRGPPPRREPQGTAGDRPPPRRRPAGEMRGRGPGPKGKRVDSGRGTEAPGRLEKRASAPHVRGRFLLCGSRRPIRSSPAGAGGWPRGALGIHLRYRGDPPKA
eukprot:7863859-Pyramimonas_sp.AAC.1